MKSRESNKRPAIGADGIERAWTPRERYMLYAKGFRDGAGVKSVDPVASGLGAYDRGYTDGRASLNASVSAYAQEIGYEPTVLRAEGNPNEVA